MCPLASYFNTTPLYYENATIEFNNSMKLLCFSLEDGESEFTFWLSVQSEPSLNLAKRRSGMRTYRHLYQLGIFSARKLDNED